jgi:hypothetical protein
MLSGLGPSSSPVFGVRETRFVESVKQGHNDGGRGGGDGPGVRSLGRGVWSAPLLPGGLARWVPFFTTGTFLYMDTAWRGDEMRLTILV